MEKRHQLIRFNAGDKGSTGILFKHDLVSWGLVINLHQVKGPIRHNEIPPLARPARIRACGVGKVDAHEFNAGD
jgi:hypothetical protein